MHLLPVNFSEVFLRPRYVMGVLLESEMLIVVVF